MDEKINIYNNGAKFLKKDIEYTFNFTVDHLFKLEPGFDAEIIISNNKNNNIKLSKENPTENLLGRMSK